MIRTKTYYVFFTVRRTVYHTHPRRKYEAAKWTSSMVYFLIFLAYPQLSKIVFDALQPCRELGVAVPLSALRWVARVNKHRFFCNLNPWNSLTSGG